MKIKLIIWLLIVIISGITWKYWYEYYKHIEILNKQEQENIKIDEYNFEQLEQVKSILNSQSKNIHTFKNINEFNKNYNVDIRPIKNCYILANKDNIYLNLENKSDYIFLFNLYSKKYRKIYKNLYYVYPESKFKIIEESLCWNHWWVCGPDIIFWDYIKIILLI